jgi:hypothetical protein
MSDPLVRPIEVVSAGDPALDMTAAERRTYAETRDPKLLRELPGKRAVRCLVRPLSVATASICDQRPSMADRVVWAFMLGCLEVQNADEHGPADARVLKPSHAFDAGDGDKRCIWSDRELGALQETFGRGFLFEIGGVIYERTLRGKAAGGSEPFTVPQSLLDELAQIARRHAERLKAEHEATPPT